MRETKGRTTHFDLFRQYFLVLAVSYPICNLSTVWRVAMDVNDTEFEGRHRLSLQMADAYANLLYTHKTQLVAADNANGVNNRPSVAI